MSETLHEWACPSCGATTRARMADGPPAPIDWPERFRAAAEVADGVGFPGTERDLRGLSIQFKSLGIGFPHVVEAIGRALLGEDS